MQGLITKCLWGYLCSDENVRLYKFCLSKQSATQLTVTDSEDALDCHCFMHFDGLKIELYY